MPITSPPVGGSSASSNACADRIAAGPLGRPPARRPSRRISTTAWAACSLVPQPVTTIGAPLLAAWPIAPASRPAGPCGSAGDRGSARPGTARRRSCRSCGTAARRGLGGVGSSSQGSGAAASGARRIERRHPPSMPAASDAQARGSARSADDHGGRTTAGRDDAGRIADPAGLEGRVQRLGSGRRVGEDDRARPGRRGAGFESIWVFDHFHTVPEPTDEITFESFTILAALAALTRRVRLGPHGRVRRRIATRRSPRRCRRRST